MQSTMVSESGLSEGEQKRKRRERKSEERKSGSSLRCILIACLWQGVHF